MRMLTAEEHSVALLNLAVPSPILRETEPILWKSLNQWDLKWSEEVVLDLDEWVRKAWFQRNQLSWNLVSVVFVTFSMLLVL
jgi:hypothetical protein